MEDTVGKCFEIVVVSKSYRKKPVVGLCVSTGLVEIGRENRSGSDKESDRRITKRPRRASSKMVKNTRYGWYFPLEALEHI